MRLLHLITRRNFQSGALLSAAIGLALADGAAVAGDGGVIEAAGQWSGTVMAALAAVAGLALGWRLARRGPRADFAALADLAMAAESGLPLTNAALPAGDTAQTIARTLIRLSARASKAEVALVEERAGAAEVLRLAHDRLQQSVDALNDGFALWDADDNLILSNTRYREIFAAAAAAIIPGASWGSVLQAAITAGIYGQEEDPLSIAVSMEAMRVQAEDALERQMADGRWLTFIEKRIADGGTVSLVVDISGRKGRENEMMEWWGLLEDQSRDLDKLTADLTAAKTVAEEADRSKSEFLAGMSHELRTPLNAVLGFAEIIRDQVFGRQDIDRYSGYAADVHASGVHLLTLINDVLDLSKLDAGKMELREEIVDLDSTISGAITLVREAAERQKLTIRRLARERIALRADGMRLKQALLNVLSNAVKFTNPGGTITIGVRADDDLLSVSVQDTGIGIDQQDIHRIFEPFHQIDGALTRGQTGTGLGMPLTKRFIEMHGGCIDIDSAPGQGTTVFLRLPTERIVAQEVWEA